MSRLRREVLPGRQDLPTSVVCKGLGRIRAICTRIRCCLNLAMVDIVWSTLVLFDAFGGATYSGELP